MFPTHFCLLTRSARHAKRLGRKDENENVVEDEESSSSEEIEGKRAVGFSFLVDSDSESENESEDAEEEVEDALEESPAIVPVVPP